MKASAVELLQFLGRSPSAPDFDQWLTALRIHGRPHHAEEDEAHSDDPDEAARNARASEIDEVERHSVALIYESTTNYRRLYGNAAGMRDTDGGDFVLQQVAFYAPDVQNYRGFAGPLPFGFDFNWSRDACREHLGAPFAARTIHELPSDLWFKDGWQFNTSYMNEGASVGIIHVRRLHLYDRRMLGMELRKVDPAALDASHIEHLLGHAGDAPEVVSVLRVIGWDPDDIEWNDCDEVPDLIRRYGVTLYFGSAADDDAEDDGSVLTGLRFNRTGDMASNGFQGNLPHGIEFHDTPPQVIARIGRPPDKTVESADTGAYLWSFDRYLLHVFFSLIDYQVYRVSCHLE